MGSELNRFCENNHHDALGDSSGENGIKIGNYPDEERNVG